MENTPSGKSPKKKKRLGPVNLSVITEVRRHAQEILKTSDELKELMESDGYAGTFQFDGGSAGPEFAAKLSLWISRAKGMYVAMPLAERTGKKKPKGKSS